MKKFNLEEIVLLSKERKTEQSKPRTEQLGPT